jgi:hypothetical protein
MDARGTLQSTTDSGSSTVADDFVGPSPWRWLGVVGRILLLWPAVALVGVEEVVSGETDLDDFLIATVGPALAGGVLVACDWLLTKTLPDVASTRGQPVPSVLRDISNVCLTLFAFASVGIVGFLIDDADGSVTGDVATVPAITLGVALLCRGLSRLSHGPNRRTGLGGRWTKPPTFLRVMGSVALIPLFILVCVMFLDEGFVVSDALVLLTFFWASLRSAMARAPGFWASQPWEATIRRFSLWAPWLAILVLLALVFGVFGVAAPFLWEQNTGEAVVVWVVLFPLGIFSLTYTSLLLWRHGRGQFRKLHVSRILNRRPRDLKGWSLSRDGTLLLTLASRDSVIPWQHPSPELLAYLQTLPRELQLLRA